MHEAAFSDIIIEICLIFLIVFLPFAFGAVGIGPQIVLISICEIVFLLFLAKASKIRQPVFSKNIFTWITVVLLAVMIFQVIPLPKSILKILSINSYNIYMDFLPGYKEGSFWRTLSFDPLSSKIELFRIMSYGLVAIVIIKNFNKKKQITRLLTVIAVTGFLAACFGVIQKFTYNGMIYWVQSVPEGAGPFGPFVNKNHFAGLMELAIPMAMALVFIENKFAKKVLFAFMAIIMSLALFLSMSRAGILSFLAALSVATAILFLRSSLGKFTLKKHIFYLILTVLTVIFAIFFILKEPLIERFSTAHDAFFARTAVYKDIWRMFMDFPIFGTGAGTFANIFSMYKTFYAEKVFTHADSDWLQFFAEYGLIVFLSIIILIWVFLKDILYRHFLGKGRSSGPRHDRFVLVVLLSCAVSIISIIFHGFVDINLHIPSNAFLFCVIAAIAFVVAHGNFHDDTDIKAMK